MKLRLAVEFEGKIDTSDFIGDFDTILFTIKEKTIKRRISEACRQTSDHNFRI